MSPLRKRVAERLVQAQHESRSLTTFNEVDMSAVMDLRARYKDAFEKAHGVKLGFMSFFVKACVAACNLFPGLNAEVIGGAFVYKKHYDFGIAVQTPKGLVVPVLRDCDAPQFADIERGIGRARRARAHRQARARRSPGRHVQRDEWRRVRLDAVDAAAQLPADRHPRNAQHRQAAVVVGDRSRRGR